MGVFFHRISMLITMFLLAQHCQIYTNTDRDPPPLQHVSTVAWKVHSGIGTTKTLSEDEPNMLNYH